MAKTKAGPINAERLKSFIERIERLEEERSAIAGDIKDVYSEAKGVGYDVKIMRKVISIRKMDAADRDEQEALLDTYMHALGMVDRIDARLAAGESQREIAKAEGVSKSTVQRRGPKTTRETETSEMDHPVSTTGDAQGEGDEGQRAGDADGGGAVGKPAASQRDSGGEGRGDEPVRGDAPLVASLPDARHGRGRCVATTEGVGEDRAVRESQAPDGPAGPAEQPVVDEPEVARVAPPAPDLAQKMLGTFAPVDELAIPAFLKRTAA